MGQSLWASPGSDGGREAVEEAGRQAAAKHRGRQEPREAGRSTGRQEGKARPGSQSVEDDGKTLTNATAIKYVFGGD